MRLLLIFLLACNSGVAAQVVVQTSTVRGYMQGSCSGGRTWHADNLVASGGVEPYSWEVVSGSLPPAVQLNPDGTFATNSTSYMDGGVYDFRARVTDAAMATDEADVTMTVSNIVAACEPDGPGCTLGASRWALAWLLAFAACVYAARREAITEATTS
jgi:hypothetical protein